MPTLVWSELRLVSGGVGGVKTGHAAATLTTQTGLYEVSHVWPLRSL